MATQREGLEATCLKTALEEIMMDVYLEEK